MIPQSYHKDREKLQSYSDQCDAYLSELKQAHKKKSKAREPSLSKKDSTKGYDLTTYTRYYQDQKKQYQKQITKIDWSISGMQLSYALLAVLVLSSLLSVLPSGLSGFAILTQSLDTTYSADETIDLNYQDILGFSLHGHISKGFFGTVSLDGKTVLDYSRPELENPIEGSTLSASIREERISTNVSLLYSSAADELSCTLWKVNEDRYCHGSGSCCLLFDMQPSATWNEPLTLNTQRHNLRNMVYAQVIRADYSLDAQNAFASIEHSDEVGIVVDLFETLSFDNACGEACRASSADTLNITVEFGSIHIDSVNVETPSNTPPQIITFDNITLISGETKVIDLSSYVSDAENDLLVYSLLEADGMRYSVLGSALSITADTDFAGTIYTFLTANDSESSSSSDIFTITVSSHPTPSVRVGEDVKWRKVVSPESGRVALEHDPLNVTVRSEGSEVRDQEVQIISSGSKKSLDRYEKEKRLQILNKEIEHSADASLVSERDELAALLALPQRVSSSTVEEEGTHLIVNSDLKTIEVEYYTQAPIANERAITSGKEIVISSDIHYQNIVAFAHIEESASITKLYHIINDSEVEVSFTSFDLDDNGLIDYIEWIVPHLSNQTYNIIYITKAEELDSDRNFVRDIYSSVSSKDGDWVSISSDRYVRVTFEYNLTSDRDITLYARALNGSPEIRVYEKDGTKTIAHFSSIGSEDWYKEYLSELSESQDSFDLYITGGDVEIDYIVDPTTSPVLTYVAPSLDNNGAGDLDYLRYNVTIADDNLLGNLTVMYDGNFTTLYDDSLLLHLDFENISSLGENSSYVVDMSKRGNNGTVYGDALYNATGVHGQAAFFDRDGDYINISHRDFEFLTNNFTISMWYQFEGLNSQGNYHLFDIRQTGGGQVITAYHSDTYDLLRAEMWTAAGSVARAAIHAPTSHWERKWHHVVLTRVNSRTISMYYDGIFVANGSHSHATETLYTDRDIVIGAHSDIHSLWHGAIDDFRIYNRTFNASEAHQLYRNGLRRLNTTHWLLETNQTNQSAGAYNFSVTACDIAGNCNSTPTRVGFIKTPVTECLNISTIGYYQLQNDIEAGAGCFTISTDNVTLDGNGYNITYGMNGTTGIGVFVHNASSVTIRNLSLIEGNLTGDRKDNLEIINSNNTLIDAVTLFTRGNSSNLVANYSQQLTVKNSSFNVSVDRVEDSTVINIWGTQASYATIENNTFHYQPTNAVANIYLVQLGSSTDVLFTRNYAFSFDRDGIRIFGDRAEISKNTLDIDIHAIATTSTNVNISENYIQSNGQSCIWMQGGPISSTISGNTMVGCGWGLYQNSGNRHNKIFNNSIQASTAVYLRLSQSYNNTYYNNTFNASATHIYTYVDAVNNTFYHNSFVGTGTWVNNENHTNDFNASIDGVNVGNIYPNITSYDVIDLTGDGAGEQGSDYPIDNSTGIYPWIGFGTDYAPITYRVGCGEIDTSDITLTMTQNLTSAGTCFNITAQNVTLIGNDYFINYSTEGYGHGIHIIDANYTTVTRMTLFEGNASTDLKHTVYVDNSSNSSLSYLNITTLGNASAVFISSLSFGSIINNVEINTTTPAAGSTFDTIYLGAESTLEHSTIVIEDGNPVNNHHAIEIGASNQLIRNNTVYSDSERFSLGSANNIIANNTFVDTDLFATGSFDFSNITGNTITGTRAINIQSSSNDNIIENNTFDVSTNAIAFQNNLEDNIIRNNNIKTTGYGIRFVQTALRNTVYNNIINTSSTHIIISIDSINNTFYNNSLVGSGIWVENYNHTNMFNLSGIGNNYENISDYLVSDLNLDGYGDTGDQYPLNNETVNDRWIGFGVDYHPITSKIGCGVIDTQGIGIVLNQNTTSYGTCFIIEANNVTLDCAGYQINYSNSAYGAGVNVTGYNSTTIENCNIYTQEGFNQSYSFGITAQGASENTPVYNITLKSNIVRTNGSHSNHGLNLQFSRDSTAYNNTVRTNGDGDLQFGQSHNYGIYVSISHNVNVSNNTIFTNSSSRSSNYGINLISRNSNVTNNLIHTGGTQNNYGMNLGVWSWNGYNNTISNNAIFANGTGNANYGINIDADITSTIKDNLISTGPISAGVHIGVQVVNRAMNNTVSNNTINTLGSLSDGIRIEDSSGFFPQWTIFEGNDIDASAYDLNLNDMGFNNTILRDQYITDYFITSPGSILIVENNYGQIEFLSVVNGSGENLSEDIQIQENHAHVNASKQGLNKSAEISLYNNPAGTLSFPEIVYNSEVACTDCVNSTSLTAATVIFNVTSWSNYSIGDAIDPQLDYVNPTPNNDSFVQDHAYVNTTSSDSNGHYVFTEFNDDLLLWLQMDQTNGSHVLDQSGRGHHANISGTFNQTRGYYGKAMYAGVGNYLTIDHSDEFNMETFTISAWTTILNQTSGQGAIVSKQSGGASRYVLGSGNDGPYGSLTNISLKTYNVIGSGSYVDWQHFTMTYDGLNFSLYLNGEHVDSTLTGGEALYATTQFLVIGKVVGATHPYYGHIDELIILNRSITPQEAASLHNASANQYEQNFTSLQDGAHTFQTHAVDRASNKVSTEIREVYADGTLPLLIYENPTPGNDTYTHTPIINLSSSDANDHYSFVDLDDSLILWLTFDELNSSDQIVDQSAGNNSLTYFGSPTIVTNGKFGKAMQFRADSGINAQNATVRSFSVWARKEGNGSGDSRGRIISIGPAGYIIYFNDVNSHRAYYNGTTINNYGSINENEWYHIASTHNGSDVLFYVDGQLQQSINAPAGLGDAISIGHNGGLGQAFNGTIDEVLIFNRTLDESEILSLYNASVYKYQKNFSDLSEGAYTFQAHSVDQAGNIVSEEVRIATEDRTNPSTTFASPTPNNDSFVQDNVYVNVTSSDSSDHYVFTEFDDDLLMWLRFDDVNASGAPIDISGYGHNGTLNGSILNNSGRFGTAASFDGINDSIIVADHESLRPYNNSFTFSLWAYTNGSEQQASLFSKEQDSNPTSGYRLSINQRSRLYGPGRYITFHLKQVSNSVEREYTSDLEIMTGGWHHLVLVVDSKAENVSFYANGEYEEFIVTDDRGGWPTVTNDDVLRFGNDILTTVDQEFAGLIDEFIFINRSLNETEISALYNATANAYQHNFTSLQDGAYTFQTHAVDRASNKVNTGTREVYADGTLPILIYENPTPGNDSYTHTPIINLTSSDTNDHYSFVDLDDSLVLWMRFDDVNGSGDPVDISGYGNNGTAIDDAISVTNGKYGKAYSFDGEDDFVNISTLQLSEFTSNNEYTISAWVNAREHSVIWSQSGEYEFYIYYQSDGRWNYHTGINNSIAPTIHSFNSWEHITIVRENASTVRIYANGALDLEQDGLYANDLNGTFTIGSYRTESLSMNGSIDEVLVFNRTLSAAEVTALYNASANQYLNNFSNIVEDPYTFQAHTVDQAGHLVSGEIREATEDRTNPTLTSVAPTSDNNSIIPSDSIYVNLSSADSSEHYAFTELDDDLVLWLTMDEENGSHVIDQSSRGNNFTIAGTLNQTSGYYGKAISPNVGNYLSIPYNDDFNFTTFTVSGWIVVQNQTTGSGHIISHRNGGWTTFSVRTNSNRFYIDLRAEDSTYNWMLGDLTFNYGEWMHFALTYNGSNASLYVNNQFDNSFATTGSKLSSTQDIFIGLESTGQNFPFYGRIDELIILNRSIAEEEIAALYNASANRYENNFTLLSDGSHSFESHAMDRAGNKQTSGVRTVTTDTTAPTLSYVDPTPVERHTTKLNEFYLNVTTTDANEHYTFANLDDTLRLWMRFDDLNGSNAPLDISGNGVNGSLEGNALINTTGKFGSAAHFDGDSGNINLGDSINLSLNASIFAWIYPYGHGEGTNARIVDNGQLLLYMANGATQLVATSDGFTTSITSGSDITVHTWQHVGIVRDAEGNTTFYVNGVSSGVPGRYSGTPVSGTTSLYIGNRQDDERTFNGSIDEVIIFNRTLTSSEIQALYNSTANQFQANFTSLSSGAHTYQAHSVDLAGNTDSTSQRRVTVDPSPPLIEFINNTQDNETVVGTTQYEINTTIIENQVRNISYTWNGTEYILYDDSLVLHLGFENLSTLGENNSFVVDASQVGNNGTCTNCPTRNPTGAYGAAYRFDGVDDLITVPHHESLSPTGDYTLSMWYKPEDNDNAIFAVLKNGEYGISWNGNESSFSYYDNVQRTTSRNRWNLSTWYHFVLIKEGSTITFYIDAEFDSQAAGAAHSYVSADFNIGSSTFNGSIDEIRLYNRSLNALEVEGLYLSNLRKINETQWELFINQSKNSTLPLHSGNYTYSVQVTDMAENINQTLERLITVDVDSPNIDFVSPTLENHSNVTSDYIAVNVSAADEYYSNVSVYLFNETELMNVTNSTERIFFVNFTDLPNGRYYYNATSIDQLNNLNSTETRRITLDRAGPNITLNYPNASSLGYNDSIDINVTSNDQYVDLSNCWYVLDGSNTSVTCNTNVTFSAAEGNHTITYYANDSLNNINSSTQNFTIDLSAPYNITLYSPTPANNSAGGEDIVINWSVNDELDANLTCYPLVDGVEQNLTYAQSAKITSAAVVVPGGPHNFSVRCYDDAGNSNVSEERHYIVGLLNFTYPPENAIFRPEEITSLNVTIVFGEDYIDNMTILVSNLTDEEILIPSNTSQTLYNATYSAVNSTPRYLSVTAYGFNTQVGSSVNMSTTRILRLARPVGETQQPSQLSICANETYSFTNYGLTFINRLDADTLLETVNITIVKPDSSFEEIYNDANITDENGSNNYLSHFNFTFATEDEGEYLLAANVMDIENQTSQINTTIYVSNNSRYINISSEDIANISLVDVCTNTPLITAEFLNAEVPANSLYNLNISLRVPPQSIEMRSANFSTGNITNLVNYTARTTETLPPIGKRRVDLFDIVFNMTYTNYTFYYNYSSIGHALVDESNLAFYQCTNISNCSLVKQRAHIETDHSVVVFNGSSEGRFMLTEPALSGDPDLFQPPTIIALNTSKTNAQPNEVINITLVFNVSLSLDEVTLWVNSTPLDAISSANVGKRYRYSYNYSPSAVGDYVITALVEDENTFNDTKTTQFRVRSPVSINISARGSNNITILDSETRRQLFRNQTHTRSIVPGRYDLQMDQPATTITVRNATLNASASEISFYSEDITQTDAPTDRTSLRQFQFNSSLDFTKVEIIINYTNLTDTISDEDNLELWKCPNVTSCNLSEVPAVVDTVNNLVSSNVSNLSLFMLAESSSTETITETVTQTISSSSSSTRNIFENQSVSLEFIPSSTLTLLTDDTVTSTIKVVNNGEVAFSSIAVDVSSSSNDINFEPQELLIEDLAASESTSFTVDIASSDVPGIYEIDIVGVSEDPAYTEKTKIIVNVVEVEIEVNQTQILERYQFAFDLFKENPECLEFQELIDQAQVAIDAGQLQKAQSLIDSALRACRDTITAINDKEFPELFSPDSFDVMKLVMGLVIATLVIWVAMEQFQRRAPGAKKAKKKVKRTKFRPAKTKKAIHKKKQAKPKKSSRKKDIWKR